VVTAADRRKPPQTANASSGIFLKGNNRIFASSRACLALVQNAEFPQRGRRNLHSATDESARASAEMSVNFHHSKKASKVKKKTFQKKKTRFPIKSAWEPFRAKSRRFYLEFWYFAIFHFDFPISGPFRRPRLWEKEKQNPCTAN
jgi:hypothetical protein